MGAPPHGLHLPWEQRTTGFSQAAHASSRVLHCGSRVKQRACLPHREASKVKWSGDVIKALWARNSPAPKELPLPLPMRSSHCRMVMSRWPLGRLTPVQQQTAPHTRTRPSCSPLLLLKSGAQFTRHQLCWEAEFQSRL